MQRFRSSVAAALLLGFTGLPAQSEDAPEPITIVIRYDADSIYLSNALVNALLTEDFRRRVRDRAGDAGDGDWPLRVSVRSIEGQDRQPDGVFVGQLAIRSGGDDGEGREKIVRSVLSELERSLAKRLLVPRRESADRRLANVTQQLKEAERSLAGLAAKRAEIDKMQELSERRQDMELERQQADLEARVVDAEHGELLSQLRRAQKQLVAAQDRANDRRAELVDRRQQVTRLEMELSRVRGAKEKAELQAEVVRLRDELALVKELGDNRQVQALSDRVATLSATVDQSAARMEAVRTRISALQRSIKKQPARLPPDLAVSVELEWEVLNDRVRELASVRNELEMQRQVQTLPNVRVQRW